MLRIQNLKIPAKQPQDLKEAILKLLRLSEKDLISWRIHKRSVDARRKDRIQLVYQVDIQVTDEKKVLKRSPKSTVIPCPPSPELAVVKGSHRLDHPPVVIGAGPAGLFAALMLAQQGYQPLVLEKGQSVPERVQEVYRFWKEGVLNPESNVQFGEGGAGTFSDGKLTTRINDPRCHWVLQALAANGAPEEILYDSKPHIGTDQLRQVVVNIRKNIENLGGRVLFDHEVDGLLMKSGRVTGITLKKREPLEATVVIAAMGHSARDLFQRFHQQGVPMEAKPFSIGVRIEHPQAFINAIQYGPEAASLPVLGAADYRLSWHHPQGRGAYSFCMCPGGQVVASASEIGGVVTNGMSAHGRKGKNANSALLVSVTPADFHEAHPLAGIAFQRYWETKAFEMGGGTYQAPAQRVEDFLAGRISREPGSVRPTYRPGVVMADLNQCLPDYVTTVLQEALKAWDRSMKGFALADALLTGVETRSSSPVRVLRGEDHESAVGGLYPAGEGCGYAGGIMSAAVDGLKTAEAVMKRYHMSIE
ncbi:NAD(P)/FAD-dependent oxidoreductase [Anoxynatronum sibiricum]|uniref:FAD-dependent protein n=1 Tax=Anoxynatronum sibiricum TaxID=210623 RepID=A0ABU9VXU3_9CLOT